MPEKASSALLKYKNLKNILYYLIAFQQFAKKLKQFMVIGNFENSVTQKMA